MGWGCVNVGKGGDVERLYGADRAQAMIAEAADSYGHFEQLIEREGIDCLYRRSGRFVGAHTPAAYAGMAKSVQNLRSEEHTSELQSLMRISYAVFCLKKTTKVQEKEKNQNT